MPEREKAVMPEKGKKKAICFCLYLEKPCPEKGHGGVEKLDVEMLDFRDEKSERKKRNREKQLYSY